MESSLNNDFLREKLQEPYVGKNVWPSQDMGIMA